MKKIKRGRDRWGEFLLVSKIENVLLIILLLILIGLAIII